MAIVMYGNPKKFSDRGYTYQRPTPKEASEMGWHCISPINKINKLSEYEEMVQWCKDNVWWQDYITSTWTFYFKHQADAVFFKLKWG